MTCHPHSLLLLMLLLCLHRSQLAQGSASKQQTKACGQPARCLQDHRRQLQ
jgi:hypothetical protein